jgi:hypothetical protein
MKLEYRGTGTGAGYHIKLYSGPDGHNVIIGTERQAEELIDSIAAAFNTTGDDVYTDKVLADFIEIEKLLCDALGRQWKPSGMSIVTLIADIKSRLHDD